MENERDEIAKEICGNDLVRCDYNCADYIYGVCDECLKIAGYIIEREKQIEAKARAEGALEERSKIINGYNNFSCPQSKRDTMKCPEGYSCWNCYFDLLKTPPIINESATTAQVVE